MARGESIDGIRMSRPDGYASIMLLFLIIIGVLAFLEPELLVDWFSKNQILNGMILGVLAFGVLYCFVQVLSLGPAARWVDHIRLRDPGRGQATMRAPSILAPMSALLRDPSGPLNLSPTATRAILDSIGTRLDETRENSRYMIGLLVFLGLLGTFIGLLSTIGAVGETVNSLSASGDASSDFELLVNGITGPLEGMGTAFSTSLFGLSGSLILGFLDLQSAQAQNRFYNDLEEFLSTRTNLNDSAPRGAIPVFEAGGNDIDQLLRAINKLQQTMVQAAATPQPRPTADGGRGSPAPPSTAPADNDAMRKLAEAQTRLEPALAKLADTSARLADSQLAVNAEIRDHLRNLDKSLAKLAEATAPGRVAVLDDLRDDVRAMRQLITSIALEESES